MDPYTVLVARVEESTGLYFPLARRPQLVAATERAMRRAGVTALIDYVTGLASGRLPIAGLIEEVVVRETYFFREPDQFRFLRNVVLPEITARKPAPLPIRLWSAACASGEEAYSLAILLEEVGLGSRGEVVGTDLSREALRKAARATYGRWSLRGEGAFRARRHLSGSANLLALDPEIRDRVRFERLNLARDLYPSAERGIGGFDLVLCRNVLIYFDAATVAHVAQRLYQSLAEDGWLVLGSSDPPLAEHAPFRKVVTPGGVFYRRQAPASDPRLPGRPALRPTPHEPPRRGAGPYPHAAPPAPHLLPAQMPVQHAPRVLTRAEQEGAGAFPPRATGSMPQLIRGVAFALKTRPTGGCH